MRFKAKHSIDFGVSCSAYTKAEDLNFLDVRNKIINQILTKKIPSDSDLSKFYFRLLEELHTILGDLFKFDKKGVM